MQTLPSPSRVLKFGVFEVDMQVGELRRSGMRQRLTGQPLQVLQILLERPQEVVTREEFRQRIWPGNTFVDYDLGLKKAVNRLREALGDSADSPRFIETIPRRGYRFVAPVEAVGDNRNHPPEISPPALIAPVGEMGKRIARGARCHRCFNRWLGSSPRRGQGEFHREKSDAGGSTLR